MDRGYSHIIFGADGGQKGQSCMAFPWAVCPRKGHALGSSSDMSVSHIMQQLH